MSCPKLLDYLKLRNHVSYQFYPFDSFPEDLVKEVAKLLNPFHLRALSCTSRRLRKICKSLLQDFEKVDLIFTYYRTTRTLGE